MIDAEAQRLADELRKSIQAQTAANLAQAAQMESLLSLEVRKGKVDFHRHTDRIVAHYTEKLTEAMAQVYEGDTIRHAIRAAYGSHGIAKAKGSPLRQMAHDRAVAVLEAAQRALTGLVDILRHLYGDAGLQGSHWGAEAADGWVTGPLAQVEADVPEDYWDDWKPGYGEAAANVATGSLQELLAEAGVTIQGVTGTQLDRIANAIADAVEAGDSMDMATKRVDAILHDPQRARLIAETECARSMVTSTLAQYDSLGVEEWDWLTAANPCALCADQAALNPHLVGSSPRPPLHPACRCSPVGVLEAL